MPSILIQHTRYERVSDKVEHLFMDATVDGVAKTIFVKIARCEKRPMFMIEHCGALCNYESLAMRNLLNLAVLNYANILDADTSECAETI